MLSLMLAARKRYYILIIAVCLILLFISILLGSITPAVDKSAKKTTNPASPTVPPQNTANRTESLTPSDNKPIVKVGKEIIYQRDLENELKYYPKQDESAKKLLLEKIIKDSKILQIGQDEEFIKLDDTYFNSPTKDYMKRVDIVRNVTNTIQENVAGIKGVIISIWFLNDHVGPLGYKKAKEIAFAKISEIQKAVKSGKMTIRAAENQIRNDSSLAQLDQTYKLNASFDFSAAPGEKISWEKEFDDILWQTEEGGITDVFLGQSFDFDNGGVKKPAYYMFGQISQRSKLTTTISLDDYISQKGQKYEVSYF